MSANTKQVGGAHYRSDYQHWDWAIDVGLNPIEYAATKYLVRWRDKNGAQDVEKALHYIDKLIELAEEKRVQPKEDIATKTRITANFVEANTFMTKENMVFYYLSTWLTVHDLRQAKRLVQDIWEVSKCLNSQPGPNSSTKNSSPV